MVSWLLICLAIGVIATSMDYKMHTGHRPSPLSTGTRTLSLYIIIIYVCALLATNSSTITNYFNTYPSWFLANHRSPSAVSRTMTFSPLVNGRSLISSVLGEKLYIATTSNRCQEGSGCTGHMHVIE